MAETISVTVPLVHHNLHGPEKNPKLRQTTITMFLDAAQGGFGTFNEFNAKDKAFMLAECKKRSMAVTIYGLNGIVWDPKVATGGERRVHKIMQGGHVGPDGVAGKGNDSRVGPNRYGMFKPFSMVEIDLDWELDVTHLVARAFTVNKERIYLWRKSVDTLADGVLAENGVLMGDMNSPAHIDLPGVSEIPVITPATMGGRIYDQVLKWGMSIFVNGMRAVNTPSDHHMLVGRITFYATPKAGFNPGRPGTKPAPSKIVLPKPGAAGVNWKKYGSPVAHPWAPRSARFKRKPLWKKILKWQTAYRRRL